MHNVLAAAAAVASQGRAARMAN